MVKTSLKKVLSNIQSFTKNNRREFSLLVIVLFVAAFLRLFKISDYMTFLGDEGRDVIIVRRFLTQGDIMLIGPGTSIGNMYLGPLYYYLMAPFLLLTNFSPVGPALMVALLSLVTVWFIWFVAREWFGKSAGLIAAFLYAISPTVIIYSRSSWNPNIMPFFALLSIYGIWSVWRKGSYKWLPVVGFSFAAALQSHYLALLLAPTILIIWGLELLSFLKKKKKPTRFITMSLLAAGIFLFLMSPLVIFDARHGYRNFSAIKVFFTERQSTVSIRPWKAIPSLYPQLVKISTRLLGGYDINLGQWGAVGIIATALLFIKSKKFFLKEESRSALFIMIVWLGVSLGGLALYKQEIYDHYYGFFFPAPFMFIGALLGTVIDSYKLRGAWLGLVAVIFLAWGSIVASPLKSPPNRQLSRSVEVTDFIRAKAANNPFNFAVIAERNYEGAYRYFFDRAGDPVVDIDPQNTKDTITSQLFVVCEMPSEKCDPTHNAKSEIANFGWSKVSEKWEVMGTTIFRLEHTQK